MPQPSCLLPSFRLARLAVLALAFATIVATPALAQTTSTWNNTSAGTADWQSAGNWNNGVPSGVDASASVIADITAPQTINLNGTVTLGSLTIGDPTASGASSYTINPGSYTSGSSTLSGRLTFDVSNGSASLSQTVNSAANLIAANVALADPLTITNSAASAALTLSGTISGSGGITKAGTGPLVLTGANTFTGGVNLSAGSLRVGNNAALGTGTATIGNATVLMANSTASRTLGNALSLSGSFTLGDATNSGAINLTGAATLTGNTQITNATYVSMSGAIGDGGNARSLTKAGVGTLVFGGSNSYTGGTTISAGTLEITANERMANTGNVTMSGGTFDLGGFAETINAFSASTSGTVTAGTLNATGGYSFTNGSSTTVSIAASLGGGAASLTKSNAGTLVLTAAGSFSGGSTITGGIVQVGSNTALGSGAISIADATLRSDVNTARTLGNALTIGGSTTLGASSTGALTFSNASPVSLSNNTTLTTGIGITFSSGLSGTGGRTFTKAGSTTLTLNGASSVDGGITINAGGITVGTGGSLSSDVTVNGGGTLTNAVTNGISGNVAVNNNGTFTVTNATSMGAVSITGTGGTVGGTGGLTASSISANITAGGTATISATLAGSGGLTKTGAGTAVVSGANSGHTGQVTLSEGLMQFGSANAFGAGTLSLVSGTLSANSTTARTLGNAVVSFDGDVTIGDATNIGVPTFSGSATLTGNRTLTFASNATLTGGLSGSGFGFTKEGAADFTLNGANTYSGTTNVNSGVLILGAASAGKTGETNVNGGTLRLANDNALGGASGDTLVLTSGAIMSNNSAARGIANAVTLAGNVTVGAGTTYTGIVTFSGPVSLTGNRTLTTSAVTTISGNIGDGGNGYRLTKNGGSTLTLSGTNSYTGGTTISNGQLTISSSAALGSGTVSISGGTLVATGAYSNVTNWLQSGRIAASPIGGIAITGNSGEALDFSSYANLSLGASASATYSGTANFTPYETDGTKIYRLGGGAGTLTFNQAVADGTNPTQVVIRGDTGGAVVLSSSNTFTGGLNLDSGNFQVSNDNQLANITGSGSNAIVFTGGYLRYSGTTTDYSSKFAMPTAGNQIAINTNGVNVSFATTLNGLGGLVKIGTGTLSAIAAYEGATNVSGGTLALTLSSTAAAPPAGTFSSSGGTLDLITSVDRTINATISQRTTGQVRLSPDAGHTLTLSGTLDRQTTTGGAPGAITVASGSVRFNGTVTSVADTDWTISGGTLELANALSDQNDTITVAAGGAVRLGASDQILTTGTVNGLFDLSGFSETLTSLAGSGTVTNASTSQASTLTLTAASTIAAGLTDSQSGNGSLALFINPTSANTIFSISNPGNDYRGGTTMQTGIMALGADNVLGSGGLTMLAGTLRSDSATARAYSGTLTVGGAVTLGSTTGTQAGALTFSGPVEISGATRTLTVNSDVTISGTIADGGNGYGLSKAGPGLLVLTGTNTYSGLTNITAGTVRAAGANSTSGATTLATAVLQLGNDAALASGTFTLTSGTLSSDGTTGRTLNNLVVFGGNATLGDATNNGTLVLAGSGTGTAVRTLTVASDVRLTGQLSGALGITKDGSGVLTITNASNSYTGGTRVNAGRVRVGSNSALGGAAGTVTLAAGSLSSDGTAARDLSNAFSVAGDFTLGDATDTGALTLTGNTLLTGNRTITFASDVTLTGVLGEQGAGRVLTKDGSGTFTLANAVSYTGGTVLNAGRIRVGVASAFGTATTTLNGGALSSSGTTERTISNPIAYGGNVILGNATDTGVLTFTGTQTLTGNRTITVASDVVMSGRIADGGSGFGITKMGTSTLTLTGTSTFTGEMAIDQGTVFVESTGVLAGSVSVNNGGTLAGSGSVGDTTVASGGTITPGNSPGTISVDQLVLEAGGSYNWQLFNATGTAGLVNGWDLIASAGTLDLTSLSSSSRFNLNTWTLSGIEPDAAGAPTNYVSGTTYRFAIASIDSLSSILLPGSFGAATNDMDLTSLFAIRTVGFNGTAGWAGETPPTSAMSVRVGLDGQSIDLVVVPEPGSIILASIGVLAVCYQALRHRARPRK
jgi:fibronectin-binding autotransporter adhesin